MEDRVNTILSGIVKTQRVSNAYLFLGGDPQEKITAAINFAKALNCTSEQKPCGACLSCKKTINGIHPDVILIEKEKRSLKIEQVRQLKGLAHYGPSEGQYKVFIICDSETLTDEAANGFLKALEEPPENVTFILISNREEGMLKTIVSRCQKIVFNEKKEFEISENTKIIFDAVSNRPADFINNCDLAQSTEDAEEMLSGLFFLFGDSRNPKAARTVFSALKNVKRGANKKLALDWMCLNLWKKN